MAVLPTKIVDRIQFGEARMNQWIAQASAVGLTEAEAAEVKALVNAARAAFNAAQIARNAAKTATLDQREAVKAMDTALSDAIKAIRLFAERTNNPKVYGIAEIPAPLPPSPAPAPVQPTDISARIETRGAGSNGGTLKIVFKAVNDTGNGPVAYIVSRKLATETRFRVVGTSGSGRTVKGLPRGYRQFVDETLPAGANNFQYIIQGQRGDVMGPASEIFTVSIGNVGADGQAVATLKMAA